MRTICLYFQIHQPFRLKRYRFFNIGNDHYYYDDYLNESIIASVAQRSYLLANKAITANNQGIRYQNSRWLFPFQALRLISLNFMHPK